MDQLVVPEPLAERLREIARRQNRSVEEVLSAMIDRYAPPLPLPAEPETDEDILRELRPKLYRIARRYWQQVGDTARLALTDEELDEQFWLFDNDGIPRLKEDQGKVEIPPDPLESIAGMIDDIGPTDFVSEMDQIREEHFRRRFGEKR